jgi:hypothetical protein
MASSRTIERSGRAGRTLMTAIHHTLRRDLDELITTTASPAAQVLSQLPAPTCLLYRTIWLPRHTRITPRCEEHQVRPPADYSRRGCHRRSPLPWMPRPPAAALLARPSASA